MLLKRLLMVNFRQFYGENEIKFSTKKGKNITLIHGENGVGKTTILNAILWCLFEKLTDDFEQKDKLICNAAVAENKSRCRVEVNFDYEGTEYLCQRNRSVGSEVVFKVHRIDDIGNYVEVPNAWAFINSVLPSDMAEYFFFHGEGISNISSKKSGDKFRRAIRDILGFTFAESAVDDLKHVKAKWSLKIKELSKGMKELEEALERKYQLEERKIALEADIVKLKSEEADINSLQDTLNARILGSGNINARRIQEGINEKERELAHLKPRIEAFGATRQALVQKYGWCIFGYELANEGMEFIDESSLRGRIPAPYDETLVKDIIQDQRCICGRELLEGTDPFNKVLSMIETANTALIQQRLQKARSVADKIKGLAKEFLEQVQRVEEELQVTHKRFGEFESDIKRLGQELKSIDVAEIAKLQTQMANCKTKKSVLLRELGAKELKLEEIKNALSTLGKSIQKETHTNARLSRLQACELIIDSMITRCGDRLASYEGEARERITRSVNDILEEFARKDYKVYLSENFEFHLVKQSGEVVAKSRGENLLLNLAFVSALILLAQERQDEDSDFLVNGTVAPFVIDAPFGELDETYRKATASFLPKNSQQLILLLSSSHWQGTVDSAIRPKIGAEYVLVSHLTRERPGRKPLDHIEIDGKTIQQTHYEQRRDRTCIQGV